MKRKYEVKGLNSLFSKKNVIQNTICYTLFLDYENNFNEIDCDDCTIEQLLDACGVICRGIFYDGKPSSARLLSKDYFGLIYPNEIPQQTMLYRLRLAPSQLIETEANTFDFFERCLLHDALIATYHTLLTHLTKNCTVTCYAVENKYRETGFWKMVKNGVLNFNKNGFEINESKLNNTDTDSSKGSAFLKSFENRITHNSTLFGFLANMNECGGYNIPINLASFSFFLTKSFDVHLQNKMWESDDNQSNSWLESFNEALNMICIRNLTGDAEKDFKIFPFDKNAVDAVYHYYLMERTLNTNLFFCILHCIRNIEENSKYRMIDKDTSSVITKAIHLPNVFSRQILIRYAFDHIGYAKSGADCWSDHPLDDVGIFAKNITDSDRTFSYHKWLEQYDRFINILADYIIPLYEGCFLSLLLDCTKHNFPDAKPVELIHATLSSLTSYIEKHYTEILMPMALLNNTPTNSDNLDIISPKNTKKIESWIKKRDISMLKEDYFEQFKNIDLNMKILSPKNIFASNSRLEKQLKALFFNTLANPKNIQK